MGLDDAATIGYYGVLNTYNRVSSTPLVWLVLAGLQLLLVGIGLSPGSEGGALGLARLLAAGELAGFEQRLTATVGSFLLLLTVFAAIGWTSNNAEAEPYVDGFLSMTTARDVALGDVLKTASVLLGGVMPVVVCLVAVVCVVGGRPLAAGPLLAALVVLFVTSQLVGAFVGMAVQYVVVTTGVSETADSLVGLVVAGLSGAVFGYPTVVGELLARTPFGLVTQLPAWTVAPGSVPTETAVFAVGTLVVVDALAFVAVGRFAPRFYLDAPSPKSTTAEPATDDREYGDDTALRRLADRLLSPRQSVLTTVVWRRSLRSSELLQRVGLYVMLGVTIAAGATNTAGLSRAPVILVLFGCIVAGSVVTTNALADEGHRMALWGATPVQPRDIYLSKTVAMGVPAVAVFGTGTVVVAATVSEYTPVATALAGGLAVVCIAASAWIGSGFGCLWIAGIEGETDADVTLPSLLVSGSHTVVVVLLVSPGLSVLLRVVENDAHSLLLVAATLAGTVVSLAGTCVLFYLAACRRMSERNYSSML
jgi:hypothetical protein